MLKIVKMTLEGLNELRPSESEHMWQHSENVKWLKENVREKLWKRFVADMNRQKPSVDTPDMEE